MKKTIFEYLYRDASNYKAYGAILLQGLITPAEQKTLQDCFEDYQFFVAEQVGIPALYEELFQYSDGPTEDDHTYHEFLLLRPASAKESKELKLWGSTERLLTAFTNAKGQWDISLSPNSDPYLW